jgi:hypothetical protein
VLHLHRLEHEQRRVCADVLFGAVRDRDDDSGKRRGDEQICGGRHRRIIAQRTAARRSRHLAASE